MPRNLSYCDIAYKILKQEKEFPSLHYKEIAKRAFQEELCVAYRASGELALSVINMTFAPASYAISAASRSISE